MCIRDSLKARDGKCRAGAHGDRQDEKYQQHQFCFQFHKPSSSNMYPALGIVLIAPALFSFLRSLATVSYTHLDVYKRQPQSAVYKIILHVHNYK